METIRPDSKPLHFARLLLPAFTLLALFGVVMRYKIGWEFPYLNQKNLQHAHSHFAFAGWVSQCLMAAMVACLPTLAGTRYRRLLAANIITAYGMLLAFAAQGYGLYAIAFSTLSIFVSVAFCIMFLRDLRELPEANWFRAGLFFNVFSMTGTLVLIVMMASGRINQHIYLASVYWYLHFQYNGWFLFAGIGLFSAYMRARIGTFIIPNAVYRLLVWSCLPAYGLSVLWLKLPWAVYFAVVLASLAQCLGWFFLMRQILHKKLPWKQTAHTAMLFAATALSIKFLLQLVSVIPAVSTLAFGFRPVVIAYLHLVLLAGISTFLLGYLFASGTLHDHGRARKALWLFLAGVFMNELVLGIQGVASFVYWPVPWANTMLFAAAGLMFVALLALHSGYQPLNKDK